MTCPPLCVKLALHIWLIFWSPGNVHLIAQPLMAALPLSAIVTDAWKPPGQLLTTLYVATHLPAPEPVALAEGEADADGLADGDCEGEGEGDGLADADALGLGLALAEALGEALAPEASVVNAAACRTGEIRPAESSAATSYAYSVPAARPLSEYEVAVAAVVATNFGVGES